MISVLQVLHGLSGSCLGSSGGHRGLSPIQSRKGHHQKEHPRASCTVLTEPPVSLAVGASQIWQAATPVSVTSIPLGAEHGAVYQFYFCQLTVSKSPHTCFLITRMGPLPAQAPFRVFTLLTPFVCHCPSISPTLATTEVSS